MVNAIKKASIVLLIIIGVLLLTGSTKVCYGATQLEGDVLRGYDGSKYHLTGYYNGYCYNSVGWLMGTLKHDEVFEDKMYHLVRDGGINKVAYCLEHRVDTNTSATYGGTSIDLASYMKFYPKDQREGITATAMFSPQYLYENSPVPGTNTDDWYWAAQVIIWEFQEGIRRDVNQGITTRFTGRFIDKNGGVLTGSGRNHYYQSLFYNNDVNDRAKPALKCYNWIINNLNNAKNYPSFVSNTLAGIKTYNLIRISENEYRVVLNDTNETGVDIFTDNGKVQISRQGSSYTITSDSPLENGEIIKGYKVPDNVNNALIIWDSVLSHRQTLMTGTKTNMPMYLRVRGELPKGNLIIHKISEDDVIGDVDFKVTRLSDNMVFNIKTDDRGWAQLDNLICGDYEITEENVPIRYEKNDVIKVQIDYMETEEITVENRLKTVDLTIEKYDEYNGQPLKNTGFKIYDGLTGEELTKRRGEDDVYLTNENGRVIIKDLLKAGRQYIVKEVEPPNGYKLDEIDGLAFNPSGDENSGVITFKNKPYFSFRFIKTTEKGNPIPGVKIEIFKRGDPEAVFSLITDDKGEIFIDDIIPGDYELMETEVPKGYEINNVRESFSIVTDYRDTYEFRMVNNSLKGCVEIFKTDAQTKEPLGDVTFGIFAGKDIINFDGIIYKKDELIEKVTTGESGKALSMGLFFGSYYIKEIEPRDGYLIDLNEYEFEINSKDAVKVEIENTKVKKDADMSAPKTGDGNNIYLNIFLLIIGISGAVVAIRLID
jgi:hypothetical protein